MNALSWIDNRTLILSQAILTAAFSVVMVGLRSFFPKLRGVTAAAAGFLMSMPGLYLLTREGPGASTRMTLLGGPSLVISGVLLFRSLVQFCASEASVQNPQLKNSWLSRISRLEALAYGSSLLALAVSLGCAAGALPFASGAMAITLSQVLLRTGMASILFNGTGRKYHLRFMAIFLFLFALAPAVYAVVGLIHPMTLDSLQHSTVQTPRFLLALVFSCVEGILYVLMFAGRVSDSVYEQARRDYLSGALNRRGIEEALASELERNRRSGGQFALMLIDIDRFKSVNDQAGHAAGDEAIRGVARSITEAVRVYDTLGRYGGDEFLLLLPQTSCGDAQLTAQRIRQGIQRRFSVPERPFVTVSIGITCCSAPEEAGEIVARADQALYDAKHAGRDCARVRLPSLSHPPAEVLVSELDPHETMEELV